MEVDVTQADRQTDRQADCGRVTVFSCIYTCRPLSHSR